MKILKLTLIGLCVFIGLIVLFLGVSEGFYFLKTAGRETPPQITDNSRKEIWNARISESIERREIILGMTDNEVIRAIGNPYAKQKNVGNFGTFETWEYSFLKYKYLHFENGTLTSWQE